MAGSTVAAARRPARETALAWARSVPVWAWLGGLVAVSTVVRWGLGRRLVAPWIMVDELIYSELAKSFAEGGRFLVRGQASAAYGVVYPAIISPAWALFDSVPDAYAAAKTINALAMSLAAVPAYFLARRVLGPWLALAAATLTVAVPSMLYTGTLMTENVFYPVFLCAALALVLYLERPTARRCLVVLALVALAYLTRAQAIALVPAVLTAPLALAWARRDWRRELRPFRLLYGLVGAAIVAVLVVQVGRGRSPLGVLGAYRVTGEHDYQVGTVARWFLYHVAELDLYVGVVPFAALLLLAARARGLDRRAQALLAGSVALVFWLLLVVAMFASLPSVSRIEERNTFYLVPLLLIALLLWIERGAPRSGRAAAVAAVVAAALPGVIPFSQLIGVPAISDTLMLIPWWRLQDHWITLGEVPAVVVLCSIAAAALFLLLPRRAVLVLPLLVLAYFAAAASPIESSPHGFRQASLGSLFAGITTGQRDWIDRAVGRDADVAVVWSGNTDRFTVWENEFFNRSVGPVYDLAEPIGGGLPETAVTVDRRTGVLRDGGRPLRHRYVLTDGSVELAGRTVARDVRKGIVLLRAEEPLRSTTRVTGLYPNDTWSGREVTYTRLSCRGGSVAVTVRSDPALLGRPQTVASRGAGRVVVPAGATRTLRVPLRPAGGVCTAVFEVSPTAVPAVVSAGQNPDPRELGVHFDRFAYRPR